MGFKQPLQNFYMKSICFISLVFLLLNSCVRNQWKRNEELNCVYIYQQDTKGNESKVVFALDLTKPELVELNSIFSKFKYAMEDDRKFGQQWVVNHLSPPVYPRFYYSIKGSDENNLLLYDFRINKYFNYELKYSHYKGEVCFDIENFFSKAEKTKMSILKKKII